MTTSPIITYADLDEAKERLVDLGSDLADMEELGMKGSDAHRDAWRLAYRLRGQIFMFEMSGRGRAPMAEWPAIYEGLTL